MVDILDASLDVKTSHDIDWQNFNLLNCTRCGLCKTRKNVVPPKVVTGSKILFIAEAPGKTEDDYGTEPLIGDAGMLFNKFLEEVGINRNDCSLSNVVLCKPPENRPPTPDEIASCHPILEHTIQEVKPQIIVPLGNVALKAITKKSGITKYNGHILESQDYPGIKIVPVVHPSFALRDTNNEKLLRFGLQRVKSLSEGTLITKTSKVTYIDTYDKFNVMMEDLGSKGIFALDIETSSLNWVEGFITFISFSSTEGSSYVLPWIIGNDQYYEFCRNQVIGVKNRDCITDITKFCSDYGLQFPEFYWKDCSAVADRLKKLLGNDKIVKCLHNFAFDYKFLERAGLVIKGVIYDTMILHYLLDETPGTQSLKSCALVHTDYGNYEEELKKSIIITQDKVDSYALIPPEIMLPYAGTDSDVTLQLYHKFMSKVIEEKQYNIYMGYLLPQTKMLLETEKEGIKVDIEYLNNAEKILNEEIVKIDIILNDYTKDYIYEIDELNRLQGELKNLPLDAKPRKIASLEKKIAAIKPGINFNSPDQVGEFLFKHLGLYSDKLTDGGKLSTDEGVLENLAKQSDFPKHLLRRRKLEKILGTYIVGVRDVIWKSDGKVHAQFLNCSTVTGRLSSKAPNMQNLPKNPFPGDVLYDLGIKCRDLFIIDDPDYVLVETDYSQAELRLVAEYSRDRNLYGAFMEGRDLHAELAVRIYHPDRINDMINGVPAKSIVTKEERFKGKTANFSFLNGKHFINYSEENGIPLDESEHIYNVYWDTYSGITTWKDEVLEEARQNGYFTTTFGRRRRIPKINSSDKKLRAAGEREGINFVFQAQASDYMLYASIAALEKCQFLNYDVKSLSFVHDSGLFRVKKTILNQFLSLLKKVMLDLPGLTIPMAAEFKVGTRYGSLEEFEETNGIWQKVS